MAPPLVDDPSSAAAGAHPPEPRTPPEPSPPQQPAPFRHSATPMSPTSTSADVESDPESVSVSDVSSIPPSEDDEGGTGARDLAASAWEDLGSSAHHSQGDHSRRPSSSSYDYSSSGRSRDGDDEETSADEASGARRRGGRTVSDDDIDGILATYIDLEPSLHSDPTLTDTSAEDASRAGVAAASTASLSSSTNTTTHDGSPSKRATVPSFEFTYPDPSTVASSFSSAQGSQHAFRRPTPTSTPSHVDADADGPPRLGAGFPNPAGGERTRLAFGRGPARRLNSDVLTPSSSWVDGADSFIPAGLGRSTTSPALKTLKERGARVPKVSLVSDLSRPSASPLVALPPRIQIVYLGLSPSQSYFDSLLRTLLNLLDASLPAGHEAVPALLRQYDLLGGMRSSKMVADIREPFRKERRVSQGAATGVNKSVCEISVGDLTVEQSDEPDSIDLIRAHLQTLMQARPTAFLFLVFETALSAVGPSSSVPSTRPLVDWIQSEFPSHHHSVRFLPVVLPSGGGFGDYSAEKGMLRIDEVLELRGPEGAETVCGSVLSDGLAEAEREIIEEPMVEVKFNASRLKKEVPKYLRTVCAVPLVFAVALLALGFLPERFEPPSPWLSYGTLPYGNGQSSPPVHNAPHRSRSSSSRLPVDEQTLTNLIKHVVGGGLPSTDPVVYAPPHSAAVSSPAPTIEHAVAPSEVPSLSSLSVRTSGEVAIPKSIAKAVSVFVDKPRTRAEVDVAAPVPPPSPISVPSLSIVSAKKPSGVDVSTESLAQVASVVLDELDASSSAIAPKTGWISGRRLRARLDNSTTMAAISNLAEGGSSKLNGTGLLTHVIKPTLASAEALATHFALDTLDFIRSSTELVLHNVNRLLVSLVRDLEPLIGRIHDVLRSLRRGSSSVADVAQHTVWRAQRGLRIEEAARRRALRALFGDASRKAEEGLARTARIVADAGGVVEAARVGVAQASRDMQDTGRAVVDETLRKSTRGLHRAMRDAKGVVGVQSKPPGPPPPSDLWVRKWGHFDAQQEQPRPKEKKHVKAKRTVAVQTKKKTDKGTKAGASGCRTRACTGGTR